MLRVALAQINTTVGDLAGNQRKINASIHQAKVMGADLVCLPELAVCGYPPEDLLYKSHFIEQNIKIINELAFSAHGITAVVGFVDQKNGKIYNAAAVLSDRKVKAVYHKQELPNYGVFDEKRYFKPGHENFLLSAGGAKIGINVCEDIWVDGASYAKQAESGAGILLNISSSPYEIGKTQVRLDLLARRAKETGCFICYTNLVGGQDELVFDGGSIIVDPKGRVVVFAKQFEEDLSIVDLDIPQNPKGNAMLPVIEVQTSQTNKPKHSEQNIPRLEETAEIYEALVLGTRDYVHEAAYHAHVGDSRIYLIRDNRIAQLTRDHSRVQRMLDDGLITAEEAATHPERDWLDRALGLRPDLKPDIRPEPLRLCQDDTFIVCTDGLTNLVREEEMFRVVQHTPADHACEALISLANDRGGVDNITVAVARVGADITLTF